MQNTSSPAICYSSQAYPYWFVDRSASPDGYCAPADAQRDNRYNAWTPALMKAAHNFQIVNKDPGAYAHNFDYSAQLLIDSIADLGADVSALVRP